MNRKQRLHRFNWFVLLACSLAFATAGTLLLVGAIVVSVYPIASLAAIFLGCCFYVLAGMGICEMEHC